MACFVAVTVNLPKEDVDAVHALAEKHGMSETHVIRQGLADRRFIEEQLDRGCTFLIEEPTDELEDDGKPKTIIREVVFPQGYGKAKVNDAPTSGS